MNDEMGVSMSKRGSGFTVKFERQLDHPPEKVWRALTERELLRRWFPCDVEGEWVVGAKLRFSFPAEEGGGLSEEEQQGEVLALEIGRLLEFRWFDSRLRFELTRVGNGCRLVFSETFTDGSIAARNAAGWKGCLDNAVAVLDDREPEPFDLSVWRVFFERLVADFTPVAGPQQGPPASHPAVQAELENGSGR